MKKQILFLLLVFVLLSCQRMTESKQVVFAQTDSSFVEEEIIEKIVVIEDETGVIEEFALDSLPLIEASVANKLAPKMKKWLSVYDLDISEFRTSGKEISFDWDQYKDQGSMYHQEFIEKEDDIYLPALHSYSPDKSLYVNLIGSLGVSLRNDTLDYYGGDDCQEIYLTSRDLKKKVMILWLGSSTIMEDCFWIDNHRFVLVGFTYAYSTVAHVYMYDIQNLKSQVYLLNADKSIVEHIDYFGDHNLGSKGLPIKIE